MKNSKLFALNIKDVLKGGLIAALTVLVAGIGTALNSGSIPTTKTEWLTILAAALSAGVAYLVKNFFSAPPK